MITIVMCLALLAGVGVQHLLSSDEAMPVSEPNAGILRHTFADLEGNTHTLSEWPDKVLFLNFWATWCPPCREEIPHLVMLQSEYENTSLQIIGIGIVSSADQAIEMKKMAEQFGINYPILVGSAELFDLMKQLGNTQGALPFTVVLSPSGEVLLKKLGAFSAEELKELAENIVE